MKRPPLVASLAPWVAGLGACASAGGGAAQTPPSVFGGVGAVVGAPKEMPLSAASANAKTASGPCAAPSPPGDVTLLDDFEDGDHQLFKAFEREGWWFAAADSTEGATLSPDRGRFAPERLPSADASKDNVFAAHMKAQGEKDWGAVWGFSLRWERAGIRCPYNLSAFGGIRFRARGPGTVRVSFGIPETQTAEVGGTCTSGCWDLHTKVIYLSDHWDDYVVRWDRLEQGGWGTEARFDPARVLDLNFGVKPKDLPIDFWVDDIAVIPYATETALLPPQPAKKSP
jgi:hypothetical protein